MAVLDIPLNWGKDKLSAYIDVFRSNQFATFANKEATADLIKIDGMYHRLLHGAINPRPAYPMNFMLRAHSAYRAGVSATMGGQLYEAQTLLRLCLEHAAYGYYIGADTNRMKRWLHRGDSDTHRKAVRKEFHNDKLKAHMQARVPVMCGQFERLFNSLIEFGAHPNELGYSLNSRMSRTDDDVHFETIFLQANGAQLDNSMKVSGQVGLWGLHLMQLVYPERYELLGIKADLEEVRQRF